MLKPWHLSNLPLQSWAINHFSSVLSLSFNVEVAFSKDISAPWPKKNMLSSSSPLASMDFHGLSMRLLQTASTGQQKTKLKATHPRLHSRVSVGVYKTHTYIYIYHIYLKKYIARLYMGKLHVMQYDIVMWGSAMYCIVVQWYDMMWFICMFLFHTSWSGNFIIHIMLVLKN